MVLWGAMMGFEGDSFDGDGRQVLETASWARTKDSMAVQQLIEGEIYDLRKKLDFKVREGKGSLTMYYRRICTIYPGGWISLSLQIRCNWLIGA